ncbi:NAD(P)H-hydrate dehydratase [Microvirga pudoricolor]|uniref:NAD(P)H-hydrate dehydratase n=1 Tax=Microvirga pudoricolor TaxID=2778729 RepID=UPI00194E6B1A|nr:NAD(P)H-hydrate dehydratase [Microvirga pudoricolor]MBM6595806.1 NAD(P)H-hydrate dehydratase [Microvirga pudoricolor]
MQPQPLLTPYEMKLADARAIAAGIPSPDLMRSAGACVAGAASRMISPGGRILVLAGPGQNGGDGFVAARLLAGEGHRVTVALLGARDRLTGDAALMAAEWDGPLVEPEQTAFDEADLIVDALFGAGLTRDLDGAAHRLVSRANAANRPILAVDLPSGIDGETGAVRGIAIRATRTVTFVTRKPGHLLMPGRAHCGPVEVGAIGIGAEIVESLRPKTVVNQKALWFPVFPKPSLASHKYDRGHALVLSGGATKTGAARMVARGALRMGAGLVTVACPPEALAVNAAHLTAIMLRGYDGPEGFHRILDDKRFNALVLGPALGVHAATRALVSVAVQARRRLVLDADALTSFEGIASELHQAFRSAPTVLTPHDGEFARLFEGLPDMLEAPSKLEKARRAAAYLGAVVLLKGPDTVVAAPDGRAAINENGSPYLATAGSGDTLCGFIAGLLAQGMPAFDAACAGTWLHAEAAASFGPGLIAEDLPEELPKVLRTLLA